MASQPILKRKRLDTVDEETPKHDPDFYFEDGNIVLSARNAENVTTLFRLHQSILAKHSPVFKDMFTLPVPADEELYHGAPVVEMLDDSVALRSLIELLYLPHRVYGILQEEDFAEKLYMPTVLAGKYQIDWVHRMAAGTLLHRWPQTLVGWDRIAANELNDACAIMQPEDYEWDDSVKISTLLEPVTTIRLARECGADSILSLAFFHLMRMPIEFEDVTDPFDNLWAPAKRELLDASDLRRLLLARERIGRWLGESSATQVARRWDTCHSPTPEACSRVHLLLWSRIELRVARNGDVLTATRAVVNGEHGLAGMCAICKMRLRRKIDRFRERFFDEFKYFFQL